MTQAATRVGYRDVKRALLDGIRDGEWPPGAPLPGEVALAARFGCARATVNRAMRELSEEGIIDRRRKAGSRVKLSPTRQARFEIPLVRIEIEATGAAYRYALIRREIGPAPDWLRGRVGLPDDAATLRLQCMHYAGTAPFQFEDRWISLDRVPQAADADFSALGPNEWLVREMPFTTAQVTFSAIEADEAVAGHLGLPHGGAVFLAERTTWLDEAPVTHARLHFARGYRMTAVY